MTPNTRPEYHTKSSQKEGHYESNAYATGLVKVILDRSFPLAEATAAHTLIEEMKTRGKVVLTI